MTHDELLAQIDKVPRIPWGQYIAALRAVVELHKPTGVFCSGCGEYYDACLTIQAIEKELK